MKNFTLSIFIIVSVFFSATINVYAKSTSKVVSLHVNGMVSPTCPALLRSAVSKIKGVKSIKASLKDKSATIEFDEKQTSLEKIQDAIEYQVGFSAEVK